MARPLLTQFVCLILCLILNGSLAARNNMEKCWLCPRAFQNKTELHSHLVSRDHRRQSVICPWCGDGKTFTRVSDLVVHCGNRHFVETNSLPKSFLTTRNCFYFAVYPHDYARIYRPEDWGSSNATEARRLVLKMLEKDKDNQTKRDNWRKGWRVAAKKQTEENKENNNGENNEITPNKTKTTVETQMKCAQTEENKKNQETAKEERPYKENVEKKLGEGEICKEDSINSSEKSKKDVVSNCVKEHDGPLDLTNKLVNNKGRNEKRKATDVDEKVVNQVKLRKMLEAGSKEKTVKGMKSYEVHDSQTEPKASDGVREKHGERGDDTENDVVDQVDLNEKCTESKNVLREEVNEGGDKEKKERTVKFHDEVIQRRADDIQDDDEVSMATKVLIDEMERQDKGELQLLTETLKDHHPTIKVEKQKKGMMMFKRSVSGKLMRVFIEQQENQEAQSKGPEKVNEMDEVTNRESEKVNVEKLEEADYMKRAENLLKTGAMPLLPPGRRDWEREGTFNIHLGGCNFTWPPPEWQKMTPDRKLMAWEHTAFQLEHLQNGSISPTMSRSFILDKYNFLALPGSRKAKKEDNEKGSAKSRFYTYQMLREVATGKEPTDAEKCQINALHAIQTKGDFTKQLEALEIPLRLTK